MFTLNEQFPFCYTLSLTPYRVTEKLRIYTFYTVRVDRLPRVVYIQKWQVANGRDKNYTMTDDVSTMSIRVCRRRCTAKSPYYRTINCFWVWKLKYIHEVKDWIVPFHQPVGKWNWQFIFHRVGIFQPSHLKQSIFVLHYSYINSIP